MNARTANTAAPTVDDATVNIFEIMDRARSRPGLISMGLGDPDLATPAHIVAAGCRSHIRGVNFGVWRPELCCHPAHWPSPHSL